MSLFFFGGGGVSLHFRNFTFYHPHPQQTQTQHTQTQHTQTQQTQTQHTQTQHTQTQHTQTQHTQAQHTQTQQKLRGQICFFVGLTNRPAD